ncbi:hypothetical protein llap_5071 [Limosa lapponica baueri]|uniref:Uncharacterized protein n=1 Tax=Limosa lapponica baueri TaxID=1758121 RepID=A0A2I0UF10_LIMLA|nr:hypothetical protein llap_5071 [Limosa lapponica baueri]
MSLSITSSHLSNTSRDGDSNTSLDSPFQCLITLLVKKFFPISILNLPWHNLRPFPLVPSPVPWEKRLTPPLATPTFQVVTESEKVSPQPPFLQAEHLQLPQRLLTRLVLQTPHQLRCPSLDTLQPLNVFPFLRGPKLKTIFSVRPHQGRVQQQCTHFPSPAGHTVPDRDQDAVGLLGHLGTLLAHIHPAVDQHPQVLFHLAAPATLPPAWTVQGVGVTQVQDLALGFDEPHTIGLGPLIQPAQIPLQTLPTLKQINTPTQLGFICKLTEVHSILSSRSLIKMLKGTGPSTKPWRTPLMTGHQLDLTPFTTILWAQPPASFFFNPVKRMPVQATSSQLGQKNVIFRSKQLLEISGGDIR